MPFQIIRNDITKIKADAIANPMNSEVTIKDTFDLDVKYIINASVPCWADGNNGEENLRLWYLKALQNAKEQGCKSIAFPLPDSDTCGVSKELGIQIAVDTFTAFLEENDMEITLVVSDSEDAAISGKLIEDVACFVEGAVEAVEDATEAVEDATGAAEDVTGFAWGTVESVDDDYFATALADEYRNDSCPQKKEKSPERRVGSVRKSIPMPAFVRRESRGKVESVSLEDALKEIYTDSFEKHLQQLINKKGLKNSEVYAAANISKQYFSKLLKGQVKPSKEKMLALAVGLRLNLDETVDFLRIAGYALSPISQTDKIVEYFIVHKDYNVLKIDIVLFDYGLDPLSNQIV